MLEIFKSRQTESLSKPVDLPPHTEGGLIAARAVARGVQVEMISRERLQLRYGTRVHRFKRGWSTLNTRLARRCTQQKEITSRLLRAKGIPTPENVVFQSDDALRAWSWAEPALPVVVKPSAASKGSLVHVDIETKDEFLKAFQAVASKYETVLIEEFVAGIEHRFAVINDSVIAVTKRVPPRVVGDGKSSIAELISAKNNDRMMRAMPLHTAPLEVDETVLTTLKHQGLSLEAVPLEGSVAWLRRTSNISLGGDAIDCTDVVHHKHVALVENAAKAIPGLRMAGFDVLLPETEDGEATVLEVNPNPMFSMHHFPWEGQARDVYNKVLDAMFPRTRANS